VEHKPAVWSHDGSSPALRRLAAFCQGALDLVAPPTCASCRTPIGVAAALCEACDRRLDRIPAEWCVCCQETTPAAPGGRCVACELSRSPLSACVAAVRYAGDAESWIHRFKYPKAGLRGLDPAPVSVVRALAREAASRAPGGRPDLIVPVPLHPRRLRARGFNPAALLARALASDLRVAGDVVALRRTRDTPSQTGLDRRGRRRNVRDAFCTRAGVKLPKRIWLVDDVVTTSSTLSEAAAALRRAGAKTVVGICAARASSINCS
jgi:ComF family protein